MGKSYGHYPRSTVVALGTSTKAALRATALCDALKRPLVWLDVICGRKGEPTGG
jgi:hypothetical protein